MRQGWTVLVQIYIVKGKGEIKGDFQIFGLSIREDSDIN